MGIGVIEFNIMRLILQNNPSGNQSASESMSILQNSKLNDSSGALSSTSSEDLENFIDANNRGFVGKICLLFNSQYRGSPTYTKITNTVSTNTFFGLCTCKWGN